MLKTAIRFRRTTPFCSSIPRAVLCSDSKGACLSGSFSRTSLKFSTFAATKQAQLISGKNLAKDIKQSIAEKISAIQANFNEEFKPRLSIIQVGNRSDSSTYVRMKMKASKVSKIDSNIIKLPENVTQIQLLQQIDKLNDDDSIHGILVQLPLPPHLNENDITNAVSPLKDVDGFHRYNIGELSKRHGTPNFLPCTPFGVIKLLQSIPDYQIKGKNAVVIGASDIVGSPVSTLLKKLGATVTTCHSNTTDLPSIVNTADILVAALGVPNFVKGDWVKEGCVIIDVGINYINNNSTLVGDCDFQTIKEKAKYTTPVPGGVGPMTVAMLCNNVFESALRFEKFKNSNVVLTTNPLTLHKPVPSDIQISKDQTPFHISKVASDLGIEQHEFEPYGHFKGKVSLKTLERISPTRENGKYVLVAGITPTPLGEGKSTTTIGLVQALGAHLHKPAIANVRQPSMGPTFGVKGGAAGGGYSQVIPMDEFNSHLTGDIHAISISNNLLAAAIDTRIFHEKTTKDINKFYKKLVPNKGGQRKFTSSMLKRLTKLNINKTDPNDLTEEEILKFARLNIDPSTITIKRVVDVNDRILREIDIGLAPTEKGVAIRRTGFDITVASELMAILALSTSLNDLRDRVGKIVIAFDVEGKPVTAEDVGCAGAITALLKDAILPNLMQTLEGQPVLVHAGPFANISIGCSSVIADKLALKLLGEPRGDPSFLNNYKCDTINSVDTANNKAHIEQVTAEEMNAPVPTSGYVVTEAGFDFTMGGERFFNIKCRASGLTPDAVVIVATTRALKSHGGAPAVKPGSPLPKEYTEKNLDLVAKGCENLKKQIENALSFGCSDVIVAVNRFSTDDGEELELIKKISVAAGAADAVVTNHWEEGGKGAIDLAKAVVNVCEAPNRIKKSPNFTYHTEDPSIANKLESIVTKIYGGSGIELSDLAKEQIARFERENLNKLPVCIAKTQYSLSHDPLLKGRPTGFVVPIKEVKCSVGGGYLYALAGKIMTIPGLPIHSGFMNVEVNQKTGEVEGLF